MTCPQAKSDQMRWIPEHERLPTAADADVDQCVFIRTTSEHATWPYDWVGRRIKWYLPLPPGCEWLEGAFFKRPVDTESTGKGT